MYTFNDSDLLSALDNLAVQNLDRLDFGVIKMTVGGIVLSYNAFESNLSGLAAERVLHKEFFVEVAPCSNNYLVAQRMFDAESLDATIDYVFTWKLRPTPVRLRMLRAAGASHMYLLVERRAKAPVL